MKRTAEQIVVEMEQSQIFVRKEYTYEEYTSELMKFQNLIARFMYGEEPKEIIRLDELIANLEAMAREKGLSIDSAVRKSIQGLKKVNKEISISMAGKIGEDRIAKILEYVTREYVTSYRNVYVSDSVEETELDNIVLTDNGIIIFEIKNAKTDITISEDGRLLYAKTESFETKSIGEKMSLKRCLLKTQIENAIREKGLNIPIYLDSYIVFSTPRKTYIQVTDNYGKEKYCFKQKLTHIIDDFTSPVSYSQQEMEQLKSVIGEMECCKKGFEINLNFDGIRKDFAQMMELLNGLDEIKEKEVETVKEIKKPNVNKIKIEKSDVKNNKLLGIKVSRLFAQTAITAAVFAVATVIVGLSEKKKAS